MSKAIEEFCFKFNGSFQVDDILNYLANYNSEWKFDTRRQETFDVHRNTETYFIHEHDLGWKIGDPYAGNMVSKDNSLIDLVWPIVKNLMSLYNGKPGQVILVRLNPFSIIDSHKDYGSYLLNSRRNHIPIYTNNNNKFIVGNEKITMKKGECWEINNAKEHSVINNSSNYRIHLIVDIIPNTMIG